MGTAYSAIGTDLLHYPPPESIDYTIRANVFDGLGSNRVQYAGGGNNGNFIGTVFLLFVFCFLFVLLGYCMLIFCLISM